MPSLVLDNSVAMRWCFKDGSETDLIYAEKVLDSLASGYTFLVPNLWHLLASQHNLSAYDAAYLELALRHQAPLATLDANLRKAANKINVPIFGMADNA